MSHTTKITGVQIVNIAAVQAAIAALQASGKNVTLVEGVIPRAYFTARGTQDSMNTPAEYVIRLEGENSYDVGLYRLADGTYEPRFDVFGGSIKKQLGVDGNDPRAAIGLFLQEYQIAVIMGATIESGKMVERTQSSNGEVHLTITGY